MKILRISEIEKTYIVYVFCDEDELGIGSKPVVKRVKLEDCITEQWYRLDDRQNENVIKG